MIKKVSNNSDIFIVESSEKLFNVSVIKHMNAYPVTLEFPSSTAYKNTSVGFIDMGASNTIITLKALYRVITHQTEKILSDAGNKANAYRHTFSSVKGVNDVVGMLCVLPEIKINS